MSSSISGIWRSGGNWFWALLEAPSFCNIDGAFLLPSVRWLEKSVICLNCELFFFLFQSNRNGFLKTLKGISNGAKLLLQDVATQPGKMHLTNFAVVVVDLVCPHFVPKASVLWSFPARIPFLVSVAHPSAVYSCLFTEPRVVSSVVLYPCMRTRDGSPSLLCGSLIPSHTPAHWQCPHSLAVV